MTRLLVGKARGWIAFGVAFPVFLGLFLVAAMNMSWLPMMIVMVFAVGPLSLWFAKRVTGVDLAAEIGFR